MKPLDLNSIIAIRETVRAVDPDDGDLLLDMIEGETDAVKWMDGLLKKQAETLGRILANKDQINQLNERIARLVRSSESDKAGVP